MSRERAEERTAQRARENEALKLFLGAVHEVCAAHDMRLEHDKDGGGLIVEKGYFDHHAEILLGVKLRRPIRPHRLPRLSPLEREIARKLIERLTEEDGG